MPIQPNKVVVVGLLLVTGIALMFLQQSTCRLQNSQGQMDHKSPPSATAAALSLQQFDLEAFLETFEAANPEWTEKCKAYLRDPAEYNKERESFINWMFHFSQYNQDWMLFVNFLHNKRKGFYVESGANHPIRVSNTAFFDYCLGWQGLCVEPSTQHHQNLREQRSCHLETVCLSNVEETVYMNNEVSSTSESSGGDAVTCQRLDTLLEKYNVTHVDLWSLDIEGFELNALRGMGRFQPDVLLMEQQDMVKTPCLQMSIDYRLSMLGYHKHRVVSDAIYVKAEPLRVPNNALLDRYVKELEISRCAENTQENVVFFDQE